MLQESKYPLSPYNICILSSRQLRGTLSSGLHANEMRALKKHPKVSFSYYFVIVFCVFRLLFTNKDTCDAYYKEHTILDICWWDFRKSSTGKYCFNVTPNKNQGLQENTFCTSVGAIDGRFNPYIERERKSLETELIWLISRMDHLDDVTQCEQFLVFFYLSQKTPIMN